MRIILSVVVIYSSSSSSSKSIRNSIRIIHSNSMIQIRIGPRRYYKDRMIDELLFVVVVAIPYNADFAASVKERYVNASYSH